VIKAQGNHFLEWHVRLILKENETGGSRSRREEKEIKQYLASMWGKKIRTDFCAFSRASVPLFDSETAQ
jgi:hypothetical protein